MTSDIINESTLYVEDYFRQNANPNLYYHNLAHTQSVVKETQKLLGRTKYTTEERLPVILAAIFHDVGYMTDPVNHEAIGADHAARYLKEKDVDDAIIHDVKNYINSTKMDWSGDHDLCNILRDADTSSLGKKAYLEKAELLRLERNAISGITISSTEWMKENVKFFSVHEYKSEPGKKAYNGRKAKNLKKIKAMLIEDEDNTISTSKSAQTMIKTALRNNIDLSSIADNKANIMLSVNALIVTVGLPLLLDRIANDPRLITPTAILAITSVASMIFATLSTRPIKMKGTTDLTQISTKKTNLFFFGNYYKMNFDEYEKGLQEVVGKDDTLDNSIARDLFFLGVSLGKKFEYLRYCYNFFMVGIVAAVLSFVVILIMG